MTRSLKEQFVSNLNGTTIDEVIVIACGTPMLTILYTLLSSCCTSPLVRLPLEIMVRCAGMVLLQSEASFDWLRFLIVPVLVLSTIFMRGKFSADHVTKKLWCISEYRGAMLWGTVVAILAVDFQVFPRRFAKTEISGISLMDLGVGSFVFAAGVVSPVARGSVTVRTPATTATMATKTATTRHNMESWNSRLVRYLSKNFDWKLFALGMIRFMAVWLSGYQSHVSEYGVHWNFFLTLFLLPIIPDDTLWTNGLSSSSSSSSPSIFTSILSAACSPWSILLIHNIVVLYGMNGIHYTLYAPRTNFFNQNREGFLSLPGYICIYKFGVIAGCYIFRAVNSRMKREREEASRESNGDANQVLWNIFRNMLLLGLLIMVVFGIVNHYVPFVTDETEVSSSFWNVLVPSRRVCNLGYVALSVGYNLFLLSIYGLMQCALTQPKVKSVVEKSSSPPLVISPLIEATDRNGFFLFLFSNICTGLVNVVMGDRTVTSSRVTGFVIVTIYTLFVSLVTLRLKHRII